MIRNRQIAYYIEQAVDEILKNGSIPTKEEVMRIYNSKVKSEPGLPTVRPLNIKKYSVTDPKAITKYFSDVYQDLFIAFEEKNTQAGKLLSLLNYYEIEKDKLFSLLNSQMDRLDVIRENKAIYTNGNIFSCYFNNFMDIDFDGDRERGIPATTCFVDLRQMKATNWRKRNKINISDSEYSIKPLSEIVESKELFPFSSAIKDEISDVWIHQLTCEQTSSKLEVVITMKDIITATSVVYTLLTTRPVSIDLYLSKDGESYIKQHSVPIGSKIAEWNFLKQEIKSIKFVITKTEPDGLNGTLYDFYFAAQNISVYKDEYRDKGVLVSKPFAVTDIMYVTLSASQMIYPKTTIKYFICKDDEKNIVQWDEIENNEETKISDEPYTGNIRLMAIFYNKQYAPELNSYVLLTRGESNG